MTKKEISRYLNVSESRVYKLVHMKGKTHFPHYKVGRLLRFDKQEVRKWFEENTKVCFWG